MRYIFLFLICALFTLFIINSRSNELLYELQDEVQDTLCQEQSYNNDIYYHYLDTVEYYNLDGIPPSLDRGIKAFINEGIKKHKHEGL